MSQCSEAMAAEILAECRLRGLRLTAHADKLHVAPKDRITPELAVRFVRFKPGILSLLAEPLPARVRRRFVEACRRLGLDPAPVLKQFDRWRYPETDLLEMDGWPDRTVEAHCRLLMELRKD